MAKYFIVFLAVLLINAVAGDLLFNRFVKARIPQENVKEYKCEKSAYPPDPKRRIPGPYTVDLDTIALRRWDHIVAPRAKQINDTLNALLDLIEHVLHSNVFTKIVDEFCPSLLIDVPDPIKSEIIGISISTQIHLGRIVFMNLADDLLSACTSILGYDSNGNLWHARNMDYGEFMGFDWKTQEWTISEHLRELALSLQFVKGGKIVYSAVQYAGYAGILTAVKPQAFSLTINSRANSGRELRMRSLREWTLQKIRQMLAPKEEQNPWNAVVTRATFDEDTTYAQAKQRLTNTPLYTPIYFILGGRQHTDGCVISRSATKAINVWELGSEKAHPWFILQTNYDHWEKAPVFDDRSDPGNYCMTQATQAAVGPASIFNVLSTKPVLNKATVYSAIMHVETGSVEAYVQECPEPCPLW